MRSTFAIAAFLLLAVSVSAQDDKKYESKAGRYLVNFPGKPTVTSMKTPAAGGNLEMNMAILQKGLGGYFVIYTDLPEDKVKLAKPADLLDGGEKGLIATTKAKVTSSKSIEFGKQKYPAKQILADTDTAQLRLTIILAENRLYQVLVVGPKEFVKGPDANKFVESFEIVK